MILQGKILEAFDMFYADEVTMQENETPVRVGKVANRAFEAAFVGSLTAFRGAEVKAVAFGEDVAMVEWFMDYTHKDWGDKKGTQVAVQHWKDGKIVSEKFYYDTAK
jgi:hypothetical protein